MILVDTSAWVEFLRDSAGPVADRVDGLIGEGFFTCGVVRMEVLAGARDEQHLAQLRGLLARGTEIATVPADFEVAAALHRTCRRRGETVRRMTDCLIAACAVREGAPVLHNDGDFDALARHTELQVAQAGSDGASD